ncbi:thiamine-phosphate kinase [Polycladomyces subterraneus]|uniref:Thiamine-monophosphate kinase n=1 Tax=Polycladomyces subterraneus TaxID=1016997 RepID=A0ABT8IP58_9BACL|nr:thiamine-phosphate kinase [Polycladomyces subterraneus]MDN4594573.1 thiamine-phosphate kinase [Polycladomyces subterraneus]
MRDEFALIRLLTQYRPSSPPSVEVDVGDDAAVVHPLNRSLVITSDTMIETVHFLPETMQPADIGWKLAAANISDIAAMGGLPRYGVVSLAVPRHWETNALVDLYRGMYDLADRFGLVIVGGDTVKAPHDLTVTLTVIGEVEGGQALKRSAAREGDVVFLTGTVGDSSAGLHVLLNGNDGTKKRFADLIRAHRRPIPQVAAGRLLSSLGAGAAANDISDGLAQECWEIAEASGVRIVLEKDKIPLSDALIDYASQTGYDPYEWALYGGEDFQLVGCVPEAVFARLEQTAHNEGVNLYRIGWTERGKPAVEWKTDQGRTVLERRGYNHFTDG